MKINLTRRLIVPFVTIVTASMLVRSIIAYWTWESGDIAFDGIVIIQSILLGTFMNLNMFIYALPAIVIILFLLPYRLQGTKVDKIYYFVFTFFITCLITSISIGEVLFWAELKSRFNFIAVDYLVYSDEVLGNIRESYPVNKLIAGVLVFSFIFSTLVLRYLAPLQKYIRGTKQRLMSLSISVILLLASFIFVGNNTTSIFKNNFTNEITKDGIYSLFSAFLNNQLPYDKFYIRHKDIKENVNAKLNTNPVQAIRKIINKRGYNLIEDNGITYQVNAHKVLKKANIVLITVESLSAEYLTMYGQKRNLTPFLDKLAEDSLVFTNLYACGTRTVYGLSALSLGIPPIPGNSIVRRPENGGLFTLGSVLRKNGYNSRFIYGGFGYFDNMNVFFSENGYSITDRLDFGSDEISFSNIWGVSDEDVFNKVIQLADQNTSNTNRKPFLFHIMTTSNHQPFTYPNGKIDIPSGTGRYGGVKYTDYAIKQFIEKSKTKKWFNNTIFVIVADHTAGSSGKQILTPSRHLIPLIIYSPKLIAPKKINTLSSQLDIPPTLIGLLGISYKSKFYGQDLLDETKINKNNQFAFIANYQNLGLLRPNSLTVLQPKRKFSYFKKDNNGQFKPVASGPITDLTIQDPEVVNNVQIAVDFMESASKWRQLNKEIEQ